MRPGGLLAITPNAFSTLCIVCALLFVPAPSRLSVSAQAEVSDADLIRASAGQVVRVGEPASGRVTTIPLEIYVARVLAGEGEPRAADAAQQALAIAIRTFVSANPGRHRRDGYDLCNDTHCQVLRTATAASRRAALTTAGEILAFEGHPAEVFYSASCGGQSEAAADLWPGAAYPYLQSVVDDVHDGESPWSVDLTLAEIERALRRVGFEGGTLTDITVEARSVSGRASRLRLAGLEPDVIAGDPFRRAVGANVLRSTAFSIARTAGGLHFVGRGFGHGVGMCVIGAGRRALRGETAHEILSRYFPGLALVRLDAAPTLTTTSQTPVRPVPAPVAPLPLSPGGAGAIVPRSAAVTIRGAGRGVDDLERVAIAAHAELSKVLGVSLAPITIELHDTLEDFRLSTGQPWWVSTVANGTTIDLAPLPVLAQRDGVPLAIRTAIAELLVAGPLAGRPAWVRVGAGRYFARGVAGAGLPEKARCPADAELRLAISATAQRDAETRAEACFARAFMATRDWRSVH